MNYLNKLANSFGVEINVNTTTYQVIPDKFLSNKNVLSLLKGFHNTIDGYTPFQRIKNRFEKKDNGRVHFHYIPLLIWDIYLSKDDVKFYLTSAERWNDYIQNQLENCWRTSTVKEVKDHSYLNFSSKGTKAGEFELEKHFYFSLNSSYNSGLLDSLLEMISLMDNDDKALIQILMRPIDHISFSKSLKDSNKKFNEGIMPLKPGINTQKVSKVVNRLALEIAKEFHETIVEIATGEAPEDPIEVKDYETDYIRNVQGISASTKNKNKYEGFNIDIRCLAYSKDFKRRNMLFKGLQSSLGNIGGDNKLSVKEIKKTKKKEKFLDEIEERFEGMNPNNNNKLSSAELSTMVNLPCAKQQRDHKNVENINKREIKIPQLLRKDTGLFLGTSTFRGKDYDVFWPTINHDQLCETRAVIGRKGSGKSLGYCAGLAVDTIRAGYSSFTVDISDNGLANAIRDSLPEDFPEEHIIDLDFGNTKYPIPLNWNEVSRATGDVDDIAEVLAHQLNDYLNKATRSSQGQNHQTERYLKMAAKAVHLADPKATILDVMMLLNSPEYRENILNNIDDFLIKKELESFHKNSNNSSRIVNPIMNRLDSILGNMYLANCVMQEPKQGEEELDFRKFADGKDGIPYCVILRVPKSKLFSTIDPIITYLIAKVWLAVLTRHDSPDKKPCFLFLDEPHQYLGSSRGGVESTWAQMLAESRKWRLGLVFSFHDWRQIGDLGQLLQSTGAHYTLYQSSSATFKALEDEIKPFTIEEAVNLPEHHAINVLRAGDSRRVLLTQTPKPPIRLPDGEVSEPQSWRHKYVDRSHLTEYCSRKFGRPKAEVKRKIFEKYSKLQV